MMPKRVLIIDDDPLVGGTIVALLKRGGYQVDAVLSGPEALDQVRDTEYDLIISDIRMPGMNGIQAIEAIQAFHKENGKKCRFMFITGYAEEYTPERAVRLGISDFLMKPLDARQFIQAIEKNIGLPAPEPLL